MISELAVFVEGKRAQFGELWVHLKTSVSSTSKRVTVEVPTEYIERVFDARRARKSSQPWDTFISEQIATFGTFIAEGYFNKMQKLAHEPPAKKIWVFISLNGVDVRPEGLLLYGYVENLARTSN